MASHGIMSLVSDPIRLRAGLDYILSNFSISLHFEYLSQVIKNGISDHRAVGLKCDHVLKPKATKFNSFKME